MNAISNPMPGPAPVEEPTVFEPVSAGHSSRTVWAIGAVAVLAIASVAMWMRAPSAADPVAADPLAENLEWFFEAALTHPGATDGGFEAPPFQSVDVQSVTIADPTVGPIVVVAEAVTAEGDLTTVTYRVSVVRDGSDWSIGATQLTDGTDPDLAATPPKG